MIHTFLTLYLQVTVPGAFFFSFLFFFNFQDCIYLSVEGSPGPAFSLFILEGNGDSVLLLGIYPDSRLGR